MPYKVIQSDCIFKFEKAVNDYMRSGWRPQGGLAIKGYDVGGIHIFAQAMVKTPINPTTTPDQ